jgi:ABC-type uncharacterized transport system permease subunit
MNMAAMTPSRVLDVPASMTQRRARGLGIFFLALAALTLFAFGFGSEGGLDATFGLTSRGAAVTVPDLVVPARGTSVLLALVMAFAGGRQLARGFGRRTNVVLAAVVGIFVFAFLAWAARGQSFSLVGMLESTLLRATPLALGALSGVLCERSGVINIAIEGMMLVAAFVGAFASSVANDQIIGLVAAMISGALLGSVLAVLSIRYVVDQIVAATFINIFALGITSFLSARVLTEFPQLNNSSTLREVGIPFLKDVPVIGPVLFDNNLIVYLMLLSVAGITWGLYRTRWGLRTRAVGEHPLAADTVGVDVLRLRFWNVVAGGVLAAMAGAFLTLGSVGRFDEGMSAGRGFIALAALIFGRHHPVGALGAALVFGFAESLQTKLAILQTPIPSEFLLAAPYLVTIVVVAGLVGKSRVPAADGQPYQKQ